MTHSAKVGLDALLTPEEIAGLWTEICVAMPLQLLATPTDGAGA